MVGTVEHPAPATARRSPGVVWGEFVARHRYPVLALGLLFVVVSAVLYPTLQARLVGVDFSVPDRDSSISDQVIAKHFAAFGTEQLAVTFSSDDHLVSD
ncbi:MAG: MMPL family transporter, partial [Williamsia herbipolensis]|nr:MMPL family transporter [Williamsia herbipolensis]